MRIAKNMAVFGLLLASINLACGMDGSGRCTVHVGIASCTGERGESNCVFLNGAALYVFPLDCPVICRLGGVTVGDGRAAKYCLVRGARTEELLGEPVMCSSIPANFVFSPKGRFALLTGIDGDTRIVDVKNGRQFTVPGAAVCFSPDENFVTSVQVKDGRCSHVLFITGTGEVIASIPGFKTLVSPYAPIMLVGKGAPEGGDGTVNYVDCPCVDPVIVDMATGEVRDRLVGRNPQFSPDGKFVLLQQREAGSGELFTAFYAADTGALVKRLPGSVESFIGEDLAALLGSTGSSATLPTA